MGLQFALDVLKKQTHETNDHFCLLLSSSAFLPVCRGDWLRPSLHQHLVLVWLSCCWSSFRITWTPGGLQAEPQDHAPPARTLPLGLKASPRPVVLDNLNLLILQSLISLTSLVTIQPLRLERRRVARLCAFSWGAWILPKEVTGCHWGFAAQSLHSQCYNCCDSNPQSTNTLLCLHILHIFIPIF